MIKKILVANRGEIAIRIMRACRELGIASVAVYSEADADALFTKYADEAYYLGPARATESYLNIPKIIEIAKESKAQAVHPGYGFLSENPAFSSACENAGIKFIGPSSKVIDLLNDEAMARQEMIKAGILVLPESVDSAKEFEKSLLHPRHIEFQILADAKGNVIYLGERECSIQRRDHKLVIETPSPALTPELRSQMGAMAVKVAKQVGYEGSGTVEFLFSEGKYYYIKFYKRIQVGHPITEMITGVDIVKEQIRIASGLSLSIKQADVRLNGAAIECRINAEDPLNDFALSPGKLRGYRSPGGIGVRVDSGVHTRYSVPPGYDPMISKLIVWGRDRTEAISRMQRALYEYIIVGVKTNVPFLEAVMENPRFIKGELGTRFVDSDATLLEDTQKIMSREKTLQDKLSGIFDEKRRVAAIAAVTAVTQMMGKQGKVEEEE